MKGEGEGCMTRPPQLVKSGRCSGWEGRGGEITARDRRYLTPVIGSQIANCVSPPGDKWLIVLSHNSILNHVN